MDKQNIKLKCKLIIQSFSPLFALILVKYFDFHILTTAIHFFKKLLLGDFTVFFRVWSNQYFGAFVVSTLSLGWIISGLIALWQFRDTQAAGFTDKGEKVVIEQELTETGVTFFMTFIFPLLLDDLTTLSGFIMFCVIFSLIFLLMWKTNLYYQNPVLTILGYKVYRVQFVDENDKNAGEKCIAICKNALDADKIVRWKPLSDSVVQMHNKNTKTGSGNEYGA